LASIWLSGALLRAYGDFISLDSSGTLEALLGMSGDD